MRGVVQRVSMARVEVAGRVTGEIERGLLVLLGVAPEDHADDVEWLANKLTGLRIFQDDEGVMNRSVVDVDGSILLVSQFTLLASTKKGNRPSYTGAARPEVAEPLYDSMRRRLEALLGRPVPTGVFGADMQVHLVNDGPVTLVIDSRRRE
ncbi:MAG: D-aminoacyl-tRNA deacylase [Verrucomicrobiota bacterium]